MASPAQPPSVICFGAYELDIPAGTLRKSGISVKIHPQPFRVLALLAGSCGQIVTREQIRHCLWGDDTFVDFEGGINFCVKEIRAALADDPEKPRYIETLPRRGYRFIAQVCSVSNGVGEAGAQGESQGNPLLTTAAHGGTRTTETGLRPAGKALNRRWIAVAAIAGIAIALCVAGAFLITHKSHALTTKDVIVLADFYNRTGDPIFDDTLKTALNVSLRQSPFLNVLPDSEIAKTLQLMTRPADTKLSPELAREVCQRTSSKAYVAGAIGSLGDEYVLALKAVNCQNGETLAQEQVTPESKEKVLDALGKASSKLRGELGESLASVEKFDVPLENATTSSLEALKAYSLGKKAFHEKGVAAALTYNQRAIELDPNFAMGYRAAGVEYGDLGEVERASEYISKAFQLREHASERERLEITAAYYSTVTGEVYKAVQTYQQQIESYPRDSQGYLNLSVEYAAQGNYGKAAEAARQGLLLTPDQIRLYEVLIDFSIDLQRFDEARQAVREAQARKLDDSELRAALYDLAFLGADSPAMVEQQAWFAARPEYEGRGLALASETEAYEGRLKRARELTKRAVDSSVRADSRESGAILRAHAALEQAAFGHVTEARQAAVEALKVAPTSQGVQCEAALAFAMTGDSARAQFLIRDLGKRFPLDTQIQSLWLPAIRARLALDRKDPAAAVSALQAALPIELGNISFSDSTSCLHHVYIRGEAYLAAGLGNAAAAEFQKIRDHDGIVLNCWTGALARLGVARAKRRPRGVRTPMQLASERSPLTKISSRCGKAPTPTFPFSPPPSLNTRSCNNLAPKKRPLISRDCLDYRRVANFARIPKMRLADFGITPPGKARIRAKDELKIQFAVS